MATYTGNDAATTTYQDSSTSTPGYGVNVVLAQPQRTDLRGGAQVVTDSWKALVNWVAFVFVRLKAVVFGTKTIKKLQVDGTGDQASSVADGDVKASGDLTSRHLLGNTATPSMTTGTGAGGTPALVSIAGTDTAGTIQLTTGGTAPAANQRIVQVTPTVAWPTRATVILTPGNQAAAALSGTTAVFPFPVSVSAWEIESGTAGLAGGTAYVWHYHVIGQ